MSVYLVPEEYKQNKQPRDKFQQAIVALVVQVSHPDAELANNKRTWNEWPYLSPVIILSSSLAMSRTVCLLPIATTEWIKPHSRVLLNPNHRNKQFFGQGVSLPCCQIRLYPPFSPLPHVFVHIIVEYVIFRLHGEWTSQGYSEVSATKFVDKIITLEIDGAFLWIIQVLLQIGAETRACSNTLLSEQLDDSGWSVDPRRTGAGWRTTSTVPKTCTTISLITVGAMQWTSSGVDVLSRCLKGYLLVVRVEKAGHSLLRFPSHQSLLICPPRSLAYHRDDSSPSWMYRILQRAMSRDGMCCWENEGTSTRWRRKAMNACRPRNAKHKWEGNWLHFMLEEVFDSWSYLTSCHRVSWHRVWQGPASCQVDGQRPMPIFRYLRENASWSNWYIEVNLMMRCRLISHTLQLMCSMLHVRITGCLNCSWMHSDWRWKLEIKHFTLPAANISYIFCKHLLIFFSKLLWMSEPRAYAYVASRSMCLFTLPLGI